MSTPKKFFSTIPGVVTGLAGLATAIVGVFTLLITLGVIGDKSSTDTSLAPSGTPGATTDVGGSGGGGGATAGEASFDASPRDVTLTPGKSDTVTVENDGSAKLRLKTPEVNGPQEELFTVVATPCTGTDLAVGASCSVTVTFKGGLAAEATMTLDAEGADSVDVELKGTLL